MDIDRKLIDQGEPNSTDRRRLLQQALVGVTSGMALGVPGCSIFDRSDLTTKNPDDFIIHDNTNWESRPAHLQEHLITPSEKLYVCSHLPIPDKRIVAEPERWQIEVAGVNNPRSCSMSDLRALGEMSVTMVLQCAGNGRQFFKRNIDGPEWGIGAAGCVTWTGVPVNRVVAMLGGPIHQARFATATGGERVDELLDDLFSMRVERSIPLTKALDDCLLAWHMNGAPIPLANGGPLRLIAPGYFGVNQIKYVRKLVLTVEQSDADIMQKQYRYKPVGAESKPTQKTAWSMPLKSWIWPPDAPIHADSQLHGVAFGGLEPLARVEISVDDGKNWNPVQFSGPDMGRYAWRLFSFRPDLPPGNWRVSCRAMDTTGQYQAQWRNSNDGGYGNTSWRDHAANVTVV